MHRTILYLTDKYVCYLPSLHYGYLNLTYIVDTVLQKTNKQKGKNDLL